MTTTISETARALGRLGKGKKKKLSDVERERRRQHLLAVTKKRVEVKQEVALVNEAEVQRRIIEEGLTQ